MSRFPSVKVVLKWWFWLCMSLRNFDSTSHCLLVSPVLFCFRELKVVVISFSVHGFISCSIVKTLVFTYLLISGVRCVIIFGWSPWWRRCSPCHNWYTSPSFLLDGLSNLFDFHHHEYVSDNHIRQQCFCRYKFLMWLGYLISLQEKMPPKNLKMLGIAKVQRSSWKPCALESLTRTPTSQLNLRINQLVILRSSWTWQSNTGLFLLLLWASLWWLASCTCARSDSIHNSAIVTQNESSHNFE